MATKKKAPKKAASKKASAKKGNGETLPEELDKEDLLTMQIAVKDLEIANLRKELASLRAEVTLSNVAKAQETLKSLGGQVNEKYSLVPGEDNWDLGTGTISRGGAKE